MVGRDREEANRLQQAKWELTSLCPLLPHGYALG
jgi:hypothetical protein